MAYTCACCRAAVNPLDPDYGYTWRDLAPTVVPSDPPIQPPTPRRDHTVVAISEDVLVMFGGRDASTTMSDVWLLYFNPSPPEWRWAPLTVTNSGTDQPGARYGHRAIYTPARNSVLVFGGAPTIGGQPVDN